MFRLYDRVPPWAATALASTARIWRKMPAAHRMPGCGVLSEAKRFSVAPFDTTLSAASLTIREHVPWVLEWHQESVTHPLRLAVS